MLLSCTAGGLPSDAPGLVYVRHQLPQGAHPLNVGVRRKLVGDAQHQTGMEELHHIASAGEQLFNRVKIWKEIDGWNAVLQHPLSDHLLNLREGDVALGLGWSIGALKGAQVSFADRSTLALPSSVEPLTHGRVGPRKWA